MKELSDVEQNNHSMKELVVSKGLNVTDQCKGCIKLAADKARAEARVTNLARMLAVVQLTSSAQQSQVIQTPMDLCQETVPAQQPIQMWAVSATNPLAWSSFGSHV